MRTYIEREKLSKYKELHSITCDWCGTHFQNSERRNADSDFDNTKSYYDVAEFELRWKTGSNYPEGGSGEECFVELCFECREKLKRLLIDNGVTIQEEDWDW